jgi:hypothetical protein
MALISDRPLEVHIARDFQVRSNPAAHPALRDHHNGRTQKLVYIPHLHEGIRGGSHQRVGTFLEARHERPSRQLCTLRNVTYQRQVNAVQGSRFRGSSQLRV